MIGGKTVKPLTILLVFDLLAPFYINPKSSISAWIVLAFGAFKSWENS
jgi:hypothetical protein